MVLLTCTELQVDHEIWNTRVDKKKRDVSPSEGEKNALSGFVPQFSAAAELAIRALEKGTLQSVRLRDPEADIADDFQIVTSERIDAFQVKWSQTGSSFSFKNLLELVPGLSKGWKQLCDANPKQNVVVHVFTNANPSGHDTIKGADGKTIGCFGDFHDEFCRPTIETRDDAEKYSKWAAPLSEIESLSGLSKDAFKRFFSQLRIDVKQSLEEETISLLGDVDQSKRVEAIARLRGGFMNAVRNHVGSNRIDMPRETILQLAKLPDSLRYRYQHQFPSPSISYQCLESTRDKLKLALENCEGGYIALIGPPGSGKSTLLNEELKELDLIVIPYFAFMPASDALGPARGESTSFFHDINVRIQRLGFTSNHKITESTREVFRNHLEQLHDQFVETQQRYVIFVDGLDHIQREYHPERSLIVDLPLPSQIPTGVFLVLGTQTLSLDGLAISITQSLSEANRSIQMEPLRNEQIGRICEEALPQIAEIDRVVSRLATLTSGHPLSIATLIGQLPTNDSSGLDVLLESLEKVEPFGTDLDKYYERICDLDNSFDFLAQVARDRLPLEINEMEKQLGRDKAKAFWQSSRHLFRQSATGGFFPFHNSFRLYLLRETSKSLDGQFDPKTDHEFRHQIATRYQKVEDPVKRWEACYQYHQIGDHDKALSAFSFQLVCQLLEKLRHPEAIQEDLRELLKLAVRTESVIKIAEIGLAWSVVQLFDSSVDAYSDRIARAIIESKEFKAGLAFILDGTTVRIDPSTAMELATLLSKDGHEFEARELFFAAEPLGQLSSIDASTYRLDARPPLLTWASLASRFRRPEQVYSMIRAAKLKDIRHLRGKFKEADELRAEMLLKLARSLISSDDKETIIVKDIDAFLSSYDKVLWLRLQPSFLRHQRTTPEQKLLIREKVLELAKSDVMTRFSSYDRILAAEILLTCSSDNLAASGLLKGMRVDRSLLDHSYPYTKMPDGYRAIFRLHRALVLAGETPSLDETVPISSDNNYVRHEQIVARHFAKLGMSCAEAEIRPGTFEMFKQTLRTCLRFMGQHADKSDDYKFSQIRALRPALTGLCACYMNSPELKQSVLAVASESERGDLGTPWSWEQKREMFNVMNRLGLPLNVRRNYWSELSKQRHEAEDSASAEIERLTSLAESWNLLNEHDVARQLVCQIGTALGTIEYKKDYQSETWATIFLRASEKEKSPEVRFRQAALVLKLSVSLEGSESPSSGCAEIAIFMATREAPEFGVSLVSDLSNRGLLRYSDAFLAFVTGLAAREELEPGTLLAIFEHFSIPLCTPSEAPLDYLKKLIDKQAADRLFTSIQTFSHSDSRHRWIEWLTSISPGLDLVTVPKGNSDEELTAQIELNDGTKMSILELSRMIDTPDKVLELERREEQVFSSSIAGVVKELCKRWSRSEIIKLANSLKTRESDGRDILHCATRLAELGAVEECVEIAKYVLTERGSNYGHNWSWEGPFVTATRLLERFASEKVTRSHILTSMGRYNGFRENFGVTTEELFREILPRIGDEDEQKSCLSLLEEYCEYVSRRAIETPSHEIHGENSAEYTLLNFVLEQLANEVTFFSEAAVLTLKSWLDSGVKMVGEIIKRRDLNLSQLRGVIAAISASNEDAIRKIRSIVEPFLEYCLTLQDFGIRAEAGIILQNLFDVAPLKITHHVPLTELYSSRPLIEPEGLVGHREIVKATGFLPDSFDARSLTSLWEYEIEVISQFAGVENEYIQRRIYDIVVANREYISQEYERSLRESLEASNLRLTFTRPRSIAVCQALHRVASELEDAGKISTEHMNSLKAVIRLSDKSLLRIPVETRPREIESDLFEKQIWQRSNWSEDFDEDYVSRTILGSIRDKCILAEYTTIRSGRENLTENRMSNIKVSRREVASTIPSESSAYASAYWDAATDEMVVAVMHFPRLDFHGRNSQWLAANSRWASEMNLEPDPERLFGWRGEKGRAWCIRWIDGDPLSGKFDSVCADGWLLLADRELAKCLLERFPRSKRIASVYRWVKEEDPTYRTFEASFSV